MAQMLDLYDLKYANSDDTVLRWMHEAGSENRSREKTYMHDKHEADEVRAYRKEYVHRDLGTSARDPSDRNMRQHHWVQMTRAKADEMTKACSPAHREHLWSIAHTYTATTAAAKGSVGTNGISSAAAAAAYTEGAVVRYEAAVDERQRTLRLPGGATVAAANPSEVAAQRAQGFAAVHTAQLGGRRRRGRAGGSTCC